MHPDLPEPLAAELDGFEFIDVSMGYTQSRVFRLQAPGRSTLYLKISPSRESLQSEHDCIRWLERRIPVPRVIRFHQTPEKDFLLMSEVPGRPAHECRDDPERTVVILARTLQQLHRLPHKECPFVHSVSSRVTEAKENARVGKVNPDLFEEERKGQSVEAVLDQLLAMDLPVEDPVVTHGDYCLPNVLVAADGTAGLVDLGRAGVADRHQDLALGIRSLRFNLGPGYEALFFRAYGIEPDPEKMAFYRLLDEFA